jgi:hypothetical protein
MFVKVTNFGPRRYVQLVEAFRDEAGLPKQRTAATLGRLDQLNDGLDSVIFGLLRDTVRKMPHPPLRWSLSPPVTLEMSGPSTNCGTH